MQSKYSFPPSGFGSELEEGEEGGKEERRATFEVSRGSPAIGKLSEVDIRGRTLCLGLLKVGVAERELENRLRFLAGRRLVVELSDCQAERPAAHRL